MCVAIGSCCSVSMLCVLLCAALERQYLARWVELSNRSAFMFPWVVFSCGTAHCNHLASQVDPSWVGWVAAGVLATFIFTALPILQWFGTLEFTRFFPLALVAATLFHSAVHVSGQLLLVRHLPKSNSHDLSKTIALISSAPYTTFLRLTYHRAIFLESFLITRSKPLTGET